MRALKYIDFTSRFRTTKVNKLSAPIAFIYIITTSNNLIMAINCKKIFFYWRTSLCKIIFQLRLTMPACRNIMCRLLYHGIFKEPNAINTYLPIYARFLIRQTKERTNERKKWLSP